MNSNFFLRCLSVVVCDASMSVSTQLPIIAIKGNG